MADVLLGFSREVQTVVTTHCAHFVPRGAADTVSYVVDKSPVKPFSTEIVGSDYELARQSLGVSLLDSMMLFPVNLVVEGPSDEILLRGAMRILGAASPIREFDVKCFPAGNATAAAYMFESLSKFSAATTQIKLLIDGDKAGMDAVNALVGRGKRDGIVWKSNEHYFQVPIDTENLLSDRVKRLLAAERPAQIQLAEDTHGKIKTFKILENKKENAGRALELCTKADVGEFEVVLKRVAAAI